ncbi:type II secretion system protein N [Aeromonas salmonicida subsp. achromogenes]|uniref:GspN family type II secretion system protein ExeN n=1 Tax=Aeromonas salmonicida TaxID=645 RepID=UPI0002DA177D|nr:GspN family type II secretion system protein ExeN [Aeromonas salmonicida]TMX07292.1 type II secretion system protein N [Aeromonas salmonicida subsp. achromogenes]TMX09073.1 type II secretion system protein N [Aeromonas salmonicida subsp. achromogenes]TMX09999.1 type II secretion system protein N [Aeromonas salmonicida subsp. achromogenes]TMX17337.1 type II secretion system protein N [Aeromonas salmonicida subsp. achromogenes]
MKKKVLIAALFLVAYLGFLLVKLPATLVVRHLPLPPNLVQLEGVSGTLWSGQVARLQYASESLTQLRWELNGWSLLRFAPEVFLRFGDRSGLNGQGVVGWNGAAFGRDITLNVPAPWVLDRVPMRLPFPLTVAGQLQLKVDQFAQGNPWCDNLYGNLYWYGADADTSAGKLPLGDPEIKLTCIDSRLVAELKQSSEAVQVMGKLELQANRQGSLKPGPELPEEMKQGLPFLGQPDGQGRFPLRYQGRI